LTVLGSLPVNVCSENQIQQGKGQQKMLGQEEHMEGSEVGA